MSTRIVSPAQLKELAAQLRAGGHGELTQELRRSVREAAKPVLADVRRAWLAMNITGEQGSVGVFAPTRGGGNKARGAHATARTSSERGRALAQRRYGSGLRQAVASATRTRNLSRGVTIEVDRTRFPQGWQNLPFDLESRRGWRHPVFGNRDVWAKEKGGPTFYPTVRKHQGDFHEAIGAAMDRAGSKLAEKVRSA
ncbi:MAG: hypothetical protein ACRDSH_16445 [Pseudonocardiaceae bacterium]